MSAGEMRQQVGPLVSLVIIDNAELHNFGSSVNSLGRRVSTYSTHDAKEIKKLLAQLP